MPVSKARSIASLSGLLLVLLLIAGARAQVPPLEAAGLDTIRVEAGCTVFLPDTTFTAPGDTLLILPAGTECIVKTPAELKP